MSFNGIINHVVMLGKDFEMKKKLFSIALAFMMCFALSAGVAAYEGIEFDKVVISDFEGGEQIQNNNCSHSWVLLMITELDVLDSAYCYGGYTLVTRFEQCINCGSTRTPQTIRGTRHSVTMSGGIVFCRICGKIF